MKCLIGQICWKLVLYPNLFHENSVSFDELVAWRRDGGIILLQLNTLDLEIFAGTNLPYYFEKFNQRLQFLTKVSSDMRYQQEYKPPTWKLWKILSKYLQFTQALDFRKETTHNFGRTSPWTLLVCLISSFGILMGCQFK